MTKTVTVRITDFQYVGILLIKDNQNYTTSKIIQKLITRLLKSNLEEIEKYKMQREKYAEYKRITIKLPDDIYEKWKALSKELNMSASMLIKIALNMYFVRIRDTYKDIPLPELVKKFYIED